MNKLYLIIFSCFVFTSYSQGFKKIVGTKGSDNAKIVVNHPKGYAIFGETTSKDYSKKNLFMIVMNTNGIITNSKIYEADVTLSINKVVPHAQGYYLGAERYLNRKEAAFIMSIDFEGDLKWSIFDNESENEVEPWDLVLSGNHLYVLGFSKLSETLLRTYYEMKEEIQKIYFAKYDVSGKKIYSKIIDKINNEEVLGSIKQATPIIGDKLLAVGHYFEKNQTNEAFTFFTMLENNQISKLYQLSLSSTYAMKMITKINEHYYLYGTSYSASGQKGIFISKLDSVFNIIWTKKIQHQAELEIESISLNEKNNLSVKFIQKLINGFKLFDAELNQLNGSMSKVNKLQESIDYTFYNMLLSNANELLITGMKMGANNQQGVEAFVFKSPALIVSDVTKEFAVASANLPLKKVINIEVKILNKSFPKTNEIPIIVSDLKFSSYDY